MRGAKSEERRARSWRKRSTTGWRGDNEEETTVNRELVTVNRGERASEREVLRVEGGRLLEAASRSVVVVFVVVVVVEVEGEQLGQAEGRVCCASRRQQRRPEGLLQGGRYRLRTGESGGVGPRRVEWSGVG